MAKETQEDDTKLCFVICPFGKPASKQRKRSDMLLEFVITPAAAKFGYTVVMADLSAEPGVVTIHIIQHLIKDHLVVADITDRNPNVFYELAIRHAIRKPFIQVIQESEPIPFDIHGVQTAEYDLQDVTKIEKTKEQIGNQIAYYETTGKVASPVSLAIDSMINTAGADQFQAIMSKLEELDSGVAAAEELRTQIVEEVRSVVAKMRTHLDSEALKMMEIRRKTLGPEAGRRAALAIHRPRLPWTLEVYPFDTDDVYSSVRQKRQRRGRGEFTIGECSKSLVGEADRQEARQDPERSAARMESRHWEEQPARASGRLRGALTTAYSEALADRPQARVN